MGILHADQYTFLISHSVCLGMRNVSDNSGRANQNTLFTFNNFFPENRAIYKILWKNIVEPSRPQMALWFMCIRCWITKATNTLRCLIFIAFPPQQWLHKCASMLYSAYLASLVNCYVCIYCS